MEKAKHAFGTSEKLQSALDSGLVDAYDILFLDGDTDPKVGWVDKNGVVRIVENGADVDLSGIEAELATKASTEEVDALENQIATKADAIKVEAAIGQAMTDSIATAKDYTDGKVEAAINEHMVKKYEITSVPVGTLVDYRDKEIRVMCPADTKWVKQTVGTTGNANMYYMAFKAYAPEDAVGFKEGDRGVIVDEYFDFNGDFAGTDEFGRNYSVCWFALALYDEPTDTWTYYGKNSSTEKYIGWTYVVEWYNADGVVIASDCIRINLSNEDCHSSMKPYYGVSETEEIETKIDEAVNTANAYTDAQIEAKLAEIEEAVSYEIVEF